MSVIAGGYPAALNRAAMARAAASWPAPKLPEMMTTRPRVRPAADRPRTDNLCRKAIDHPLPDSLPSWAGPTLDDGGGLTRTAGRGRAKPPWPGRKAHPRRGAKVDTAETSGELPGLLRGEDRGSDSHRGAGRVGGVSRGHAPHVTDHLSAQPRRRRPGRHGALPPGGTEPARATVRRRADPAARRRRAGRPGPTLGARDRRSSARPAAEPAASAGRASRPAQAERLPAAPGAAERPDRGRGDVRRRPGQGRGLAGPVHPAGTAVAGPRRPPAITTAGGGPGRPAQHHPPLGGDPTVYAVRTAVR